MKHNNFIWYFNMKSSEGYADSYNYLQHNLVNQPLPFIMELLNNIQIRTLLRSLSTKPCAGDYTLEYVGFQLYRSHMIICFFLVHSLKWLNFKIRHPTQVLLWFTLHVLLGTLFDILWVIYLYNDGGSCWIYIFMRNMYELLHLSYNMYL